MKLGAHEFEAEGAPELVAAHFRTWQDLIAAVPPARPDGAPSALQSSGTPRTSSPLDLFAVDLKRSMVTLRRHPGGAAPHADAALLLLYGFHQSLGEEGRAVAVTRLKAALNASGHPGVRINRTLERYRAARLIKKRGRRKGSTYELTPSGSQRAATLVKALGSGAPAAT